MDTNTNTAMQVAANYQAAHTTIKNALNAINSLYFISGYFIPDELRLRLREAETLLNDAYSNTDHHAAIKYFESLEKQSTE